MIIDAILALLVVLTVGIPIVIAFDRAKKEMEADEDSEK